jgi:NAD(P)-dependent dehydrogenase (short-subunit alcohol dehydrogenase family)
MNTVLITGATGGIGSATARRLDGLGWRVFVAARSLEAGERLAQDGKAITPVELDVTDESSIARARGEVSEHLDGRGLSALINNAGLVVQGPLELVPSHALHRQFEVNVIGPVLVTQAFLPLLRAGGGRVINISGAAARTALPFLGPISASKAALESWSDALRMELKRQGIPVSIVVPGLLDTGLHDKAAEASRRDGFAGSAETHSIYAEALEIPEQIIADSKLAPVDTAVSKIVKALTDARPAPRYLAGRDARQLGMLRLMPDRLRDRLLMWNFGLKPERFASPSRTGSDLAQPVRDG